MRKIIPAAVSAAAAVITIALPASAAPATPPVRCHVSAYRATGRDTLRGFLRHHQVHDGMAGLLAANYTCSNHGNGGWTPDWTAYLREINGPAGTSARLIPGMRVLYVAAGPRA